MPWEFADDVATYAEHVWDLLYDQPVEHTLALTVIESVRAGRRWSDADMVFGWYEDGGQVRGAVSMTPPYELLLAAVPDETVAELVGALRNRAVVVPGVHGDVVTAERFGEAWTAGTQLRMTTTMRMRLYALGTLRSPAPAGRARPAGERDLDLAVRWMTKFQQDAHVPAIDVEPMVRGQVDDERLWLWLDEDDSAVALAGRSVVVSGMSRVGPVYTPPEWRRRGYGAAVTAACTEDALHRGAEHVVLFTDLANPTSNSIYQQIGFRPVSDRHVVHFGR